MHRILCAILVPILLTTTTCIAAELASGLYAMKYEGPGEAVARADADGQIVLGQRLSPQLRNAAVVSLSNDNSQFQVSLVAGPIAEGTDRQRLAIVVAGRCMPVASHRDRGADGSIAVQASVLGQEAAEKIAAELGVKPRLRTHPGHQLLVSFKPQRPKYRVGEPVTLTMTIRNVGKTTVRFYDGGSQRGPRNNQFGFTAFGSYGFGKPVPDTGDPTNFGGMMGLKTLGPSDVFVKDANLSDWFKFNSADSYQVTGMYHLTLLDENSRDALWDDFAVGRCVVWVVADATGK